MGLKIGHFEKEFAEYKDIEKSRVAAGNSCTAALHLSLIAARISPVDEMIVPTITFCATVNAVIHTVWCGCKVCCRSGK